MIVPKTSVKCFYSFLHVYLDLTWKNYSIWLLIDWVITYLAHLLKNQKRRELIRDSGAYV